MSNPFLKNVLHKYIFDSQSIFVSWRYILANVMVFIEIVHYMKAKTQGNDFSVILKLLISKASNQIDWLYLKETMLKMGFSCQ